MGISDLLEIGKQGLAANRQALTTTSNNIANANTPGYSRQRPVMESNTMSQTDGVFIGGGVSVPKVIRVHDVFIDRQIIDESRAFGAMKARADGLRQMESLLTRNGYEVGESVNSFFNAYRELSANPENPSVRNLVLESADSAARSFRRVHDSMSDMQTQIDQKLGGMVDEINAQAQELAGLNEKITFMNSANQEPNELLDRRDVIVKNLSLKLGCAITSDENGHANIAPSGMGSLVFGSHANLLEAGRSPAMGDKNGGNVDIFVRDSFGVHRITEVFKEGEFAGLIQVRDQYINGTLKQLDSVAYEFARAVNDLHRTGTGLDGNSSRDIFQTQEAVKGFSSQMAVSEDVKGNLSAIASGFEENAPGDNRLAVSMAELQNRALMPSGGLIQDGAELRSTLSESLNSIAGRLAASTAKEDEMLRHQTSIMDQLENYRQNISGVSLEEEAIQMMQYQAVFNASAKAMRVGDELLQTILSLKD